MVNDCVGCAEQDVEGDEEVYTSDGLIWSLVICARSRGKIPDFLKASTRRDGRITSSHVDLNVEQKFFLVISVLGFC